MREPFTGGAPGGASRTDHPDLSANAGGAPGGDHLCVFRLRREFVRFCAVGASGYAVNLAVYAALERELGYVAAAVLSFCVAACSNYVWNRVWTFEARSGSVVFQGLRALGVSLVSLAANQLFLISLVAAGAGHLAAQAAAILLVTPFSFAANKVWTFSDGVNDVQPAAQRVGP
jgi:putative flippase GtrA